MGGSGECNLVLVLGTREHPPKPPFGNHPFAPPRLLEKGSWRMGPYLSRFLLEVIVLPFQKNC